MNELRLTAALRHAILSVVAACKHFLQALKQWPHITSQSEACKCVGREPQTFIGVFVVGLDGSEFELSMDVCSSSGPHRP
jgi:hypothetical protein